MAGPAEKGISGPDGSTTATLRSPRRGPLIIASALTDRDREIARRDEVVVGLEGRIREMFGKGRYLIPIEKSWQPSDFLPDLGTEKGRKKDLLKLQKQAEELPDSLFIVIIGNLGTEEALPTYQVAINRPWATRDMSGADEGPWPEWTRGWTSEENRHGEALMTYVRYSGRADMRAIEKTIQSLIAHGFDPGTRDDPYNLLAYTSFQERATKISHGNTTALAEAAGDETLSAIGRHITGDEARHERFYTDVMDEVFKVDPHGAIIAFYDMLTHKIVMPAALMTNGEPVPAGAEQSDLFTSFSDAAQRIGVYTAVDYVNIINHFRERWKTDTLSVSGEAARAQEGLGKYTDSYGTRLDAVMTRRARSRPPASYPWLHGREVPLFEPSS